MIIVEIPKKELLRQLPEKAGYALMQWLEDMPQVFVFEAMPAKTKASEIWEKWPQAEKLTYIERVLFFTLYGRGKVSRPSLYYTINKDDDTLLPNSNILDVHIKNLRRKLRLLGMPFEVVTSKAGFGSPGYFALIVKE